MIENYLDANNHHSLHPGLIICIKYMNNFLFKNLFLNLFTRRMCPLTSPEGCFAHRLVRDAAACPH